MPSGQHRRYTAERFAAREQRVLRAHGRPSSAVVETELGLPRPEQWRAFLSFRGGAVGLPKVSSQYCFLPIAASAAPRWLRFPGLRFATSAMPPCIRSQAAYAQSGNECRLPTPCPKWTENHAADFAAAFNLPSVAYCSYEGGRCGLIHLLKHGGIQRASSVLDIRLAGCSQAAVN